jgi:branched-chain amino acid transport system substrate-binding protein
MRTRILLAFVLLATVALAACCPKAKYECTDEWGCATFEPGQTVKVAYVGPMTGPYAAFGTDISRGAELAVKANPDVEGFEFELVIEDTQGSGEQSASVANKLVSDLQVVAIAGHTFSGSTLAAIPIYEEAGIPMMSPSTTLASFTAMGSEVYNRVAFSDALQAAEAAAYIYNELGVTKIVTVHDSDAYGKGLAEGVAAEFEALGGEVLGIKATTQGAADYSAALADVAALEPELIYYGGYDADAALMVTQMAGAGLEGVTFFGCDGTYGTNYLDLTGDASEGTFSTNVPIPASDAFEQFKADYEAAYGEPQGKLSPYSSHGHDAAAVLLDAIDRAAIRDGNNLVVPRKGLAEEIRKTSGFSGLTSGSITCDSTGECGPQELVFMVVENGEWVEAPGQ